MSHIQLYYGPNWFSGLDLFMDFLSIIILLLVAFFAWTYYRLDTKKKKPLLLFVSMASLALAFFFKILAYFSIYITRSELKTFSYIGDGVYQIQLFNVAQASFFVLYSAIMIAGLFILYSTISEKKSKKDLTLFVFLLAAILAFTFENAYVPLNITALAILVMISLSFIEKYKTNKMKTTKLLAISFILVAASKLFFLLTHIHQWIYVFAEIAQLAGFVMLLLSLRLVLKNAKKA